MIYEFVYVTIHYDCGHEAIHPELIARVGARERWSYARSGHCSEMRERRYETARERERFSEWPPVARVVQQEEVEA